MKLTKIVFALSLAAFVLASSGVGAVSKPKKADIIRDMALANNHFIDKWPDPHQEIIQPNRVYESNLWTRAVYFEGLMDYYNLTKDQRSIDYALKWGQSHNWQLRGGSATRNADNQCAGQTYIELYMMDRQSERIAAIKESIDLMMATDKIDDWSWIDAIQMAMPIFAQLGVATGDKAYFERAYEMYTYTRNKHGKMGLYNPKDGLWWRDKDFVPPYKEPNGANCYWSRGNGWVIMAMARMLRFLPADEPNRREYARMLKDMSEALALVQREDGLWNVSLHDPNNFGGRELSGTAMFIFGMAYGVNNGILDKKTFAPVIYKGWNGIVKYCLHPNGFLGYVQGTGKEPKDSQPVTFDRKPNFDDFALGAMLMAGCEIAKMR